MPGSYTLVLRSCPESNREIVAQLLGRAFSLKDSTCVSIAGSTPIVLLGDLGREEAAALSLVMAPLSTRGAELDFTTTPVEDLPKIDWPRRPLVFKREIADHVADCHMVMPIPGSTKTFTLLELLVARLNPGAARAPLTGSIPKNAEFRGSTLPEITPFSNQVLPPPTGSPPSAPTAGERGDSDAVSRLNELFPEDDVGFMPNNEDISSILNRLLPDEEQAVAPPGAPQPPGAPTTARSSDTSRQNTVSPGGGHSVFLAKIADEGRRAKVVTLLEELAKLSHDEAEALSKKVIIPVLRDVRKEEAEAVKQRFAKIGILARVKAPEP